MNKYEREAAFLGKILSYDDTHEGQRLKAKITQAQQDERCVRRALRLPTMLVLLATVSLGYWKLFGTADGSIMSLPALQLLGNGLVGLDAGSLFALLVLSGLVFVYHKKTFKLKEAARRHAANLLETRLGSSATLVPVPAIGNLEAPEI